MEMAVFAFIEWVRFWHARSQRSFIARDEGAGLSGAAVCEDDHEVDAAVRSSRRWKQVPDNPRHFH